MTERICTRHTECTMTVEEGAEAMSQRDRILNALRMGPVCGTDLLGWYIPRYAARILELRREGFVITSEPCRLHFHETRQTVYRLVGAEVGQLQLLTEV